MRINSITFFNQPNNNNTPEFRGYKSVFSKTLDEVIVKGEASKEQKNKMTGFITRFVNNRLKYDRVLGRGLHGAVYKIDDKYVLKIDKGQTFYFPYDFLGLCKQNFSNIKSYFGEPVTTFGNGIKIMRNVSTKHIPVGVPKNLAFKMTRNEMIDYYKNNYLSNFCELPQKTFDGVAKAFDLLNKKGKDKIHYEFDTINPNNFVLVGKQIRIVDEIYETSQPNPNNLTNLLKVFLTDSALGYDASALGYRKEIFKKLLLASEKYELPHGYDIINYSKCFNLCGIKDYPNNVLKNLETIRSENKNMKIRLQKISDYLNTL